MTPPRRSRSRAENLESSSPSPAFWRTEWEAFAGLLRQALRCAPWILLLTVAAFATRFWGLADSSLWMDEIVIFREAFTGEYKTVSYSAHKAHLFPVAQCMKLLGQTPFGVRFWGALLGALAVPLAVLAGLLAHGRRAGVAAGALVLLHPFLLLYARDANYYGGMTFYTAFQVVCYLALFRGMPHVAFLGAVAASAASFWNHPISALASGLILGGMSLGVLLFRDVREQVLVWTPSRWLGRPAVPLLGLALLGSLPLLAKILPGLLQFADKILDPGSSTLTNVEFGFPLFRDHLTGLGLNFFRRSGWESSLFWLPALFLIGAGGTLLADGFRRRVPASLALGGLVLLLPLCAYAVLFSLSLNRNFNLRYFTFLIPPALVALAAAAALLGDARPERRFVVLGAVLGLPLLLYGFFSVRLLTTDVRNVAEGVRVAKEAADADARFYAMTRNDGMQARFYLDQAGRPSKPPRFFFYNSAAYADLLGGALPVALAGEQDLFLFSAWRHVEMPNAYAFVDACATPIFVGQDKLGEGHDLRLARWDAGDRLLLPNLFSRFQLPVGTSVVAVAGAGTWRVARGLPAPFADGTFTAQGPGRFELRVDAPTEFVAVPELPATVALPPGSAVNIPEHTRFSLVQRDGVQAVRSERDGAYDFLVFQPVGGKRRLAVELFTRDEADPVLAKNPGPVPSGLLLAVAVDGVHRGVYDVGSGMPRRVRLELDLNLEPGNHRVSLMGFLPRLSYTPHFAWEFIGAEWSATTEAPPTRSLEEQGKITLSPGWTARPPESHQAQGLRVVSDPERRGPAGDAALRFDVAANEKGGAMLLGPAIPVLPGTLATYWFYVRMEGLEAQELTPVQLFVNASGAQVGGAMAANGSNLRGTALGKGWVRRQVFAPVPEGAAYLMPGFQMFPLAKGETEGARVWVASFSTPGLPERAQGDPALPEAFFGAAELPTP